MTSNASEQRLNTPFDIPIGELEERIKFHLNGDFGGYSRVVSPRAIVKVNDLIYFKKGVFASLIRNIPLRSESGEQIYPYANSAISVYGSEPKSLLIGQTFVSEEKILAIMGGLGRKFFKDFEVKGISKMPPAQIYGIDEDGRKAIAFYIPPLVEHHDNREALIDGIHRSSICGSAGTTINSVHIYNVECPLPFDTLHWDEVEFVREKPPIELRYRNLRKELFRDLRAIGVDG